MNNKVRLALLLVLCITHTFADSANSSSSSSSSSNSTANSGQCKAHQAWLKAKPFLQAIAKNHSQAAQNAVNKFVTAFENQNPSTSATSTDLGVCTQYVGQQSCCNAEITKFLDLAALYKVKPIQQQNDIIQKFMNGLIRMMGKSSCNALSGKTKPSSVSDLTSNTSLTALATLLSSYKTCKVNFATAIVQYTRGAACTICAGVDKLSSYFDASGNLIVSSSSVTSFQTAVNDAITCFSGLANVNDSNGVQGLITIANQVTAYYVDSTCQTAIANRIQTIFTNNGGVSSTSSGSNVCSASTVYSVQSSCEGAQQGGSSIDTQTGSRLLRDFGFEGIRLLQTDATTSSSSGVNIVVTSSSDSSVDSTGAATISTSYDNGSSIKQFLLGALFAILLVIY